MSPASKAPELSTIFKNIENKAFYNIKEDVCCILSLKFDNIDSKLSILSNLVGIKLFKTY